jgi:hypothetical protein
LAEGKTWRWEWFPSYFHHISIIIPSYSQVFSRKSPVFHPYLGAGLTGPNVTVDTACSASLVATNAAAHMMVRPMRWQKRWL